MFSLEIVTLALTEVLICKKVTLMVVLTVFARENPLIVKAMTDWSEAR